MFADFMLVRIGRRVRKRLRRKGGEEKNMEEKKNVCVRLATPQEMESDVAVVLEYFKLYSGTRASGYVPEKKYVYCTELEGYERVSREALLEYLYYNHWDEDSANYFFAPDFI